MYNALQVHTHCIRRRPSCIDCADGLSVVQHCVATLQRNVAAVSSPRSRRRRRTDPRCRWDQAVDINAESIGAKTASCIMTGRRRWCASVPPTPTSQLRFGGQFASLRRRRGSHCSSVTVALMLMSPVALSRRRKHCRRICRSRCCIAG